MRIIIDILKLLIESHAEFLGCVFSFFKHDHRLKANFGSKRMLNRKHTGYAIGDKQLSELDSGKSKIIIGPSGTGKSTLFFMNTLFSSTGNFVVMDSSGELLKTTGASLKKRGYAISVINPNNADASTHGWNPFEALKNSSENTKSFASLLVNNALEKTSDVFWNLSSINLLALFMDFMMELFDDNYHNLYILKYLLQRFAGDGELFDTLFSQPEISDDTFNAYKAFIASDTKIITGVLANCQAVLGVFDNSDVARVTSNHSFSMEHFINADKQVVFIQNSVLSQEFLRPVNSLFFYFFFEALMREIRPKEAPMCYFLIDEASSIKLGSMLPLCLVNMRKFRASICLGVQSFQQLETIYSREDAINILQNCYVKVFLRNLDISFSKMLSDMLGAYTYQDSKSETDRNRMLLTPDMIRAMREEECLLFVGAKRGILLKNVKPFYKIKKYLRLSKLPPVELEMGQLPFPEKVNLQSFTPDNANDSDAL
jgi:type IV secretion system protein VirD4